MSKDEMDLTGDLLHLIEETLGVADVDLTTTFDSLGMDSLDWADLILAVEVRYHISLGPYDEKPDTVADLAETIQAEMRDQ